MALHRSPLHRSPLHRSGQQLDTKSGIIKSFPNFTRVSASGWFSTADPDGLLAPSVPLSLSNLLAIPLSVSQINLSWNNNDVANTDNIIIQWTADGIAQADIMLDGSTTSHSLTLLEADTYHMFIVFAQNTTGNSNPVTANATTNAVQVQIPTTPTLTAVNAISQTTLQIVWTDNSYNEDNFTVQRSLDGLTGWETIATPESSSYNDTTLSAEQTRFYRVAASNAAGDAWSSAVSGTTSVASGSQPIPIPTAWLMYGDSQTAGRAVETEALSHVVAFTRIYDDTIAGSNIPGFSSRASLLTDGFGGRSLEGHEAAFNSDKPLVDPAWMHFQESGGQDNNGQRTALEFGQTFEDFVNNIATEISGAGTIISTETAFSFGREAESYRNWDSYNTEQANRIAALAGQGITVYVADVDANIKALQTELTPGDVWYQTGETNNYHYTGIGNIMIALTLFDMLGYDVDDLVTTGFTTTGEITQNRIATCKSIIKGRSGAQRTITGTGFGVGPTVVLFDRFEGTHGENIDLAGAEIASANWGDSDSTLAFDNGGQTRYWAEDGRTWMTCRDSSDIASSSHNGAGLYYDHPTAHEEFFVSYRMMIPDTYKYPGASNANQLTPLSDNTSRWKQLWLSNRSGRYDTNDMVLGAVVGEGLGVGGNTFLPRYWNGSSYVDTSLSYSGQTAVGQNLISMYVSGPESSEGAHDATYETVQFKDGDYDRRLYQGNADPYYHTSGTPTESINSFSFNGWSGSVSNWSNVMMLMTDAYMAVGPNAGARIYTHDQPTLAGSSIIFIIPPDSWTDTEIKYTPRPYEDLPYVSIVQSDLTVQEDV